MAVKITRKVHDGGEKIVCFRCLSEIDNKEQYLVWTVDDHDFVQCTYHRNPTKAFIGLTVLYRYGYDDQPLGTQLWRINRVNRNGTVLNPATPSYLNLEQILELYENPLKSVVDRLIEENFHINQYMKIQAEAEIAESSIREDEHGIRRGARVLSQSRNCSNCGVSEAEMVKKNPRYTLCRGVCVVCYRKMFRKKGDENGSQTNGSTGNNQLPTSAGGPAETPTTSG